MLVLLTIGTLSLVFTIQPAKSEWTGTVYIRADGSIDPPDAPIQQDGNIYTLTGNITSDADGIVVKRDNIIINGAGYTIQGTGSYDSNGIGIYFSLLHLEEKRLTNITVENLQIINFTRGIYLYLSTNCLISGNKITNNQVGVELGYSSNNTISGNNITANNNGGVMVFYSNNNTISRNLITLNKYYGIELDESGNNTIFDNKVVANIEIGIESYHSDTNTIIGNLIADNWRGIQIQESNNNVFYHNAFVDNLEQVYDNSWMPHSGILPSNNSWDNGYPSGGNYWSDYTGVDLYSGPLQNETGSDGIGDTPYIIDEINMDRYPSMPKHELIMSITAPTSLNLGGSYLIKATVTNKGSSDETNVELSLFINDFKVNSTIISLLQVGSSYTLTYLWTPTVDGTYNITAYAYPVTGEISTENNQETKFVTVSPTLEVGVKAGDWIKVEYTVSGWPSGQPYPEWLKVEFLTVEGINITVRVTMHMSDGTEQNATVPVIIGSGGGEAFGLSGFVIPANLTVSDPVYITGYDNVTIEGETTRTYAGASRTVVYASFSQYGTQLTYYWDKQTGVMVEASTTSGGITATAKVTETNMWQPAPSGFPIEPIFIIAITIIIIIIAVATLLIRKRKT